MGGYSTCALLSNGTVNCWGLNDVGQLGDGTTTSSYTCVGGSACSATPVTVSGLTGVIAVSAGASSTYSAVNPGAGACCALLSNGTVDCSGSNEFGQLGNSITTSTYLCGGSACSMTPVAVAGLTGVTAISEGVYNTCALLSNGTVDCWGLNDHGQLGDGTTTSSSTPVAVMGLTGVTADSEGDETTCALLLNGTVECWGDNYFGELGNGTTTDSSTPVAVTGLSGSSGGGDASSDGASTPDGESSSSDGRVDGSAGAGTDANADALMTASDATADAAAVECTAVSCVGGMVCCLAGGAQTCQSACQGGALQVCVSSSQCLPTQVSRSVVGGDGTLGCRAPVAGMDAASD